MAATASAAPRRGRPSRGARVETKLPADALESVEFLTRTEGPDRSAVIARLVETGIAAWDMLISDVAAVRGWAEEWPTCCGVIIRAGRMVNLVFTDPNDPDGILEDHLCQERLPDDLVGAAKRLLAARPLVISLGFGHSDGIFAHSVVVRCGVPTPRSIMTSSAARTGS